MADIQKRGGYTPRRSRETKAYRLVQVGSATGIAGIGTLVLALVGVMSYFIPILLLVVTALCVWRFATVTGQR